MKKLLIFPLILCGKFALAQLNESFNDANFTSSPVWNGSTSGNDFTIASQQLRSNSTTANSNIYLSTANTISNDCQWEFWVNLQFNPSGANYVDVYLTSDQANLQSSGINGYFVRIGNTNDEISLYKRTGTLSSAVKIIDGADGILNTSNNRVKIKVTRSIANVFTLERDLTGLGTSFSSEGSIQDITTTSSAYFGIFIQQSTTSFHQKHFFDDLSITSLNTDNTPPSLSSATVVDSIRIQLNFSEALDSTTAKILSNYSINNNYGHPVAVNTTSDASKYLLRLSKGLVTSSYQVSTSGIKDKAGNTIASGNSASFSYVKPFIARRGDLVINEIFADPAPQIDLPSVEFVEIYNPSGQTVKLNNWKYSDATTTAGLPADSIKAGEFIILCAKADTNEFKVLGKTVGISPWPSLNNSSDQVKLVSPEHIVIDSVSYSDSWHSSSLRKQGGWSLERMNYKSACTGLFNWSSSVNISGGTPGIENSVFIPNYDQLGFKADSIIRTNDSTLVVYFNKPADVTSQNNSFILSPQAVLKSITFDQFAKQATLKYSKLPPGTTYHLNIASLKDCAANHIAPIAFQFQTPPVPPVRLDTASLFITEVLADPSPEVNLPLAEFIEIFNPGKDTVNLDGWTLSDPTAKVTITKRSILPNEYIILCPAQDTLSYKSFGKVIGLAPWPSLNNASDQLSLKSFSGRLVDTLSYSDTWHSTPEKKQGGWSLERRDYTSMCKAVFNWNSSIHANGGTPGQPNSIALTKYDKLSFKADSLKRSSDSTLIVYFNKSVDITSVNDAFRLSPQSNSVKSFSFDLKAREATLVFKGVFLPGSLYQLEISQLKDCAGNVITFNPSLNFSIPKLAPVRLDTAKIYITEILADPSPEIKLPLAEFVEVYNPGNDTLDLDNWTLIFGAIKATLKKASILPKDYLILCPSADTTQYKAFGKVAGLSSWPALTNSAGQIAIKSFKGRLTDSIAYSDAWHSSTTKKQGGWSLERIDYQSVCGGAFNWLSSIDPNGGTPGRINSVSIENYDKTGFRADSLKQVNDTSLVVYFNKFANVSTSSNTFNLSPSAGSVKAAIFENKGSKATLTFQNKFEAGRQHFLSISNLKDCAGNVIASNSSLSFVTPKLAPVRLDTAKIYITEILADPSPEVKLPLAEFIEVYNPGNDTVDLDNWSLTSGSVKAMLKKISILPKEYLILCPSADTTQYKAFGKVAGLSSWPALTNSAGQIAIKSFKGRLTDSIAYSDAWHSSTIKKQGGWSLERIDYQSVCSGAFNWLSSIDPHGGTPARINSVNLANYDKTIFRSDSIKQVNDTSLVVYFNKFADVSTGSNAFNLTPSAGSVKTIIFENKERQATLTFQNKFEAGRQHFLSISNLKDCAGNAITSNSSLSFVTPKLAPVRLDTAKLLITEIFADPSPEVQLPLVEFIEIFNPGRDTVDLEGWTLNNTRSKGVFKKSFIPPLSYKIICSTADTIQFQPLGKVAGIAPWPTLINIADKISLKSFKGRTVDSVSYSDSWYKDKEKQSGGWSLELIEAQSFCTEKQNWMASKDASGGTPGRQNSVYQLYKSELLKLSSASLKDSVTISLSFNRSPDSSSVTNISNYTINNGVGKPLAIVLSPSFNEVELKFSKDLTRGNNYRIHCPAITDCSGTLIASSHNSAEFFYPQKIKKNNILISEVLFNPREGSVDFVEIYNNSDEAFDLKELFLASIKAPDSIINKKQASSSSLIFSPHKYLVLTTNPELVKKEYHTENPTGFLKMSSMPAYNNDFGSVVLLSGDLRIDQFDYSEKMHFPLIKDAKGVSLERTDFNRPANQPGNFRSAAATVGYATPGYKNSQAISTLTDASQEVDLPSKTFSPDNDGFEDALQINYHFKDAGLVANVSVYNDKGILIKKLVKNSTLAIEGSLVWDGMTEDQQRATVGIYIVSFDVFNLNGKTQKFKKACVLASKLN